MKKNILSIVGIFFVLLVSMVMLSGCGNKDDSTKTDGNCEYYCTSQSLEWNETGIYIGEISLPEDSKESFKDVNASDFELTATMYEENEEEPYTLNLKNFTVTKVDDKTIRYEFTSPLADKFDVSYTLLSKKSVVTNNNVVYSMISISEPDIYLTGDAIGAYYGCNEIVLNVEFGNEGKFVNELTSNMFAFPAEFNSLVKVNRISDTKAQIVVENVPTDLNTGSIDVVVSKEAIDSKYAKDINLSIAYAIPRVIVDEDSVSFDKATNTLTIGKMYVNGGTGVKDTVRSIGFEVIESEIVYYAELLSQSFNEQENYYTVSLKVNDKIEGALQKLKLCCDIKLWYQTITYQFSVYCGDPYLNAEAGDPDKDENTVSITLTLDNGKFIDNLTLEDINIDGNDLLTDFTLTSVSEKKLVLTAKFEEGASLCELINISIPHDKLKDTYTDANCSVTVDVIVLPIDRTDWSKFGLRVGKNSLGLIKNPLLSKVILPEFLNFLEIDTSDNKNNKIQSQVKELRAAVEDLSRDIKDLRDLVTVSEYRNFIENTYTPLDNKLSLLLKSYLSKDAVIDYIAESAARLEDCQKGQEDYAEFNKFIGDLGYDTGFTHQPFLKYIYNYYITKCKERSYDSTISVNFENIFGVEFWKCDKNLIPSKLEELYQKFRNWYPLVEAVLPTINEETKNKFIAATDQSLTNLGISDYISTIKLYGSYITDSNIGHGISCSVIEKYFTACDEMYNFESQTIQPKKAFLARVQYNYIFNAAFAKTIMVEKGEEAVAEDLEDQMILVNEFLDPYWKKIEEMETRQKQGKDCILVCEPAVYVSKSMAIINIDKFHGRQTNERDHTRDLIINLGTMGKDVTPVSVDNILQMCERAKSRNVTLAEDLINSGFKNIQKDSKNNTGTKYTFLCAPVKPDYKYVKTWKSMVNIFGGLFDDMNKGHKFYDGDIVTQSSVINAKKIEKCRICDNQEYEGLKSGYIDFHSDYYYLIGFKK